MAQDIANPFSIDDEVKEEFSNSEADSKVDTVPTETAPSEAAKAEVEEVLTEVPVPRLTGPVVDQANILSGSQISRLDSKIRNIYDKGGPQLQILIVESLSGFAIEDYSIAVAEQWKIGNKDKGNGVIILMSKSDRSVRIEVGEGAEGELTDVESHQIIQYGMIPEFKLGNFFAGFDYAVSAIALEFGVNISANKNLKSPKELAKLRGNKGQRVNLILPLIIFFFTFPLIAKIFGKNVFFRSVAGGAYLGALSYFIIGHLFFIILAVVFGLIVGLVGPLNFLMATMSGSGRGGYHSGGGGFGGGGGWSGGGGGFSGGGASGSW